MMKAKLFLFAVLAASVLLGACVGTKALGVLDESIPEDQRCNLEIRNSIAVIAYNNQPVEWEPGLTDNKVTIALPPGEHSFIVRYYETRSIGPNLSEAYPVTANISGTPFVAGHSYRIYMQKIWLVIITLKSVKIKDVTPKK